MLSISSSEDKILSQFFFAFAGEDNYLYQINISDFCEQKLKKFSYKKLYKLCDKFDKLAENNRLKADFIKKTYQENTILKHKSCINRYKNCSFVDKDNAIEYPFRLRVCKSDQPKPLFVYLHGAGSLGNKNIWQLLEYLTVGIKIKAEESYVLIPQCHAFAQENLDVINTYTRSLRSLIELLCQQYNIDKNRIYISGISFGGACVWYSLYNNPDFYAGAIPLMGYMPDVYSDNFDYRRFQNEKIWSAHAQNDKVVSISDDKKLYELLKSKNYDIKFSEYTKYGHSLAPEFYKHQLWKKWLFAQKKCDKFNSDSQQK